MIELGVSQLPPRCDDHPPAVDRHPASILPVPVGSCTSCTINTSFVSLEISAPASATKLVRLRDVTCCWFCFCSSSGVVCRCHRTDRNLHSSCVAYSACGVEPHCGDSSGCSQQLCFMMHFGSYRARSWTVTRPSSPRHCPSTISRHPHLNICVLVLN